MKTVLRSLCLTLTALAALTDSAWLSAEDTRGNPAADEQPAAEGYRLQPADDPLQPLQPREALTESERKRMDGLAWYMTGQMLQKRNDLQGALDAYRKAVAADPQAVEVYEALVPLAFALNQEEEAMKLALKLVELDPDNYLMMQQLGRRMAVEGKLPQAIELLEKARATDALDRESGGYVTLMRDLAVLYGATGEKDKAADAYEVVFDALQNPRKYNLDFRTRRALREDAAANLERIGQAFLDAERFEPAIEAFESASKQREGVPGHLSYNLAQVYLKTNKPEKALEELQKYFDAQLQSKGREAYELLGQILKALDKSDELLGRLEELAQKDPHNGVLQYYLAEQYVEHDRLADAEKLYRQTLEKSGSAAGWLGLAVVYRKQSRPAELLESLSKAIGSVEAPEDLLTLAPLEQEFQAIGEDPKLVEELIAYGRKASEEDGAKLDFASSLILAKLAAVTEEDDAAVHFYRFAIKSRRDRAPLLYEELGQYLMGRDKNAEAAEIFREAADDPASSSARPGFLMMQAQAEELAGNTDAAVEAIKEAQRIRPDLPRLQLLEAWIYSHSARWDDAIALLERIIEKNRNDKDILRQAQFTLSNVYVQQGNMRKGEEILEKVYEEDPNDPSVNNDLGYLYADQGKKLEQAEKMIRLALESEPENPAYLDSMGWVLYRLEKYEEALPYLEKAVELPSGADATILDHLADTYDRLGKTDKAVENWKKALQHAKDATRPDQKLIQQIEDKLKKHKAAESDQD